MMYPFYGAFQMRNLVTNIGTEELTHLEMVATIVHQLTKDLTMEEIDASSFRNYYVDHTIGIWPQSAGGVPFTATQFQSTGNIITDLTEFNTSCFIIHSLTNTLSRINNHKVSALHNQV